MKFLTNDGRKFDTIEEAEKHEKELDKAIKEKERLAKEKGKRAEEVQKAYDYYCELRDKYLDDYPESDTMTWQDFFDKFFS